MIRYQLQCDKDHGFEAWFTNSATYDKQVQSWNYTRLQCNDGTRSPSCVCGGETRGCCSHHGGVAGCPKAYPDQPLPDTSPLLPNELLETESAE